MRSIFGVIGQICHHFGWTYHYTVWEMDWRILQRMLIDLPKYNMEDPPEKEKAKKKELKAESAHDLFKLFKDEMSK